MIYAFLTEIAFRTVPNLQQLVYSSIPSDPVRDTILDIVRSAEIRNQQFGVSGMLVYSDVAYLQLLEGRRCDVQKLFALIAKDPRHRVMQVWTTRITRRSIARSLPMGYADAVVPMEYLYDLHGNGPQAAERLVELARAIYPMASNPEQAEVIAT